MKFKINKAMLKFVLDEWENKESKLFKGFNVYQPILEVDTKEIKNIKIESNSKYQSFNPCFCCLMQAKDDPANAGKPGYILI